MYPSVGEIIRIKSVADVPPPPPCEPPPAWGSRAERAFTNNGSFLFAFPFLYGMYVRVGGWVSLFTKSVMFFYVFLCCPIDIHTGCGIVVLSNDACCRMSAEGNDMNKQVEYHVIADDKLSAWTMGAYPTYQMAMDAIDDFLELDKAHFMDGYYSYHIAILMK